ncbi:hypothetical protein EW145_g4375, partial [Phellinidium pouzarii]
RQRRHAIHERTVRSQRPRCAAKEHDNEFRNDGQQRPAVYSNTSQPRSVHQSLVVRAAEPGAAYEGKQNAVDMFTGQHEEAQGTLRADPEPVPKPSPEPGAGTGGTASGGNGTGGAGTGGAGTGTGGAGTGGAGTGGAGTGGAGTGGRKGNGAGFAVDVDSQASRTTGQSTGTGVGTYGV